MPLKAFLRSCCLMTAICLRGGSVELLM
jgi:hypothetical protein